VDLEVRLFVGLGGWHAGNEDSELCPMNEKNLRNLSFSDTSFSIEAIRGDGFVAIFSCLGRLRAHDKIIGFAQIALLWFQELRCRDHDAF
jgi:hypothetical protein